MIISIRKVSKECGGFVCRSCLNEMNYPVYIHHKECSFTDIIECAVCREKKHLVKRINLNGILRLLLVKRKRPKK